MSATVLPLLIITNGIRNAEHEARYKLELPRRATHVISEPWQMRGINDRLYRLIESPVGYTTRWMDTLRQLDYMVALGSLRRATDDEIALIRLYFTEGLGKP